MIDLLLIYYGLPWFTMVYDWFIGLPKGRDSREATSKKPSTVEAAMSAPGVAPGNGAMTIWFHHNITMEHGHASSVLFSIEHGQFPYMLVNTSPISLW